MNSKIKNYVDVLFKGIPNTNKAQELKEEILSNLNEHFEAHIAEGMSENQAYTSSLADLGDIDELLKTLEPEEKLKDKIDSYRARRAKTTAISVMLFILSIVFVIGFGGLGELIAPEKVEVLGLIGVICMFVCIATGVGLIIYSRMSMPQDVSEYITKRPAGIYNYEGNNKKLRILSSVMKLFWLVVLIIYLSVSFATGAWYITWIIWIIASAVKQAILAFADVSERELDSYEKD